MQLGAGTSLVYGLRFEKFLRLWLVFSWILAVQVEKKVFESKKSEKKSSRNEVFLTLKHTLSLKGTGGVGSLPYEHLRPKQKQSRRGLEKLEGN